MNYRMVGPISNLRLIAVVLTLTPQQHAIPAMLCDSHLEIRQKQVVIQSTEYTCGAAAIATLMQHFYSIKVSEFEVLTLAEESMRARGVDPEVSHGLTALDLKHASHAIGVEMAGYRVDQDELADYFARGGLPLIAHLMSPRKHFVVVIGIRDTSVLIADPSWGKKILRCSEFDALREHRGVVLIPLPSQQEADTAKAAQREALLEMDRTLDQLRTLREEMH